MNFAGSEHQHQRYDPLHDQWILVSPHRLTRPWQGQVEDSPAEDCPDFDPTNPLCPGVTRASGIVTENYTSTYVFNNDFPALLEDSPIPPTSTDPLFQVAEAKGVCKVMCFHPKSNVHFAKMSLEEIEKVITEWISQTVEIGQKYEWVQVFENRGAIMGCSNPHPHCQIWASAFLPNEARVKDKNLRGYYESFGKPMLQDYVEKELKMHERIVIENDEWVILVPFWAQWPFETMVLPKRQVERFNDLDCPQRQHLAQIIKHLLIKYENTFRCKFPYSMGWHGAPTGSKFKQCHPYWTFHGCYYPPLLRSATVKKFMVGYEMLAQAQRDLTPEKAAAILRDQSDVHYSEQ